MLEHARDTHEAREMLSYMVRHQAQTLERIIYSLALNAGGEVRIPMSEVHSGAPCLTLREDSDTNEVVIRAVGGVVGTNEGHGHVWPRPDGVKARCGGPHFCDVCRDEHKELWGTEYAVEKPTDATA